MEYYFGESCIMRYKWDKLLETGNSIIDNQHRQLFSALNELTEAHGSGNGSAELERVLDFLNSYVVKHFGDEEKIMRQIGYSDYGIHKLYHESFKTTVSDLTRQLLEGNDSEEFILQVGTTIADWLNNHIKGDDFKLAAHLQSLEVLTGKVENCRVPFYKWCLSIG